MGYTSELLFKTLLDAVTEIEIEILLIIYIVLEQKCSTLKLYIFTCM